MITAALGPGIQNALIAIMVAWWPAFARLVRGLVLAARERDYVLAAYALGATRPRVLPRARIPRFPVPQGLTAGARATMR